MALVQDSNPNPQQFFVSTKRNDRAKRERRKDRRCRRCYQHSAKFIFNRFVRWDRHHDLCVRCYRSVLDQQKVMSASL
jgi:hypothetical protein